MITECDDLPRESFQCLKPYLQRVGARICSFLKLFAISVDIINNRSFLQAYKTHGTLFDINSE